MKRSLVFGLVAVMSAALAVPAMAQPGGGRGPGGGFGFGGPGGGGGGGIAMLVMNEAVQKEIDLLDEQIEDIRSAMEEINENRPEFDFRALRDLEEDERNAKMEEFREAMQKLTTEAEEKLGDILLPEQLERVQQIQVQMMGVRAVQNERVAKELDLTESQKEKIADAFEAQQEKMRARMEELRGQGGRGQGGPGGAPGQGGQGGRGGFGAMQEEMQKMNDELEEKVMDVLTSSQKDKLEDLKGEEFDTASLRGGRGGRGGQGGPGGAPGQGAPGGRGPGGRGPGGNGASDRA